MFSSVQWGKQCHSLPGVSVRIEIVLTEHLTQWMAPAEGLIPAGIIIIPSTGCLSLKIWHKSDYCSFTSRTYSYFKKWFETLERVSRSVCPTLSDPMYCSPPGSSVHGMLQARILEEVAIPFSRGSIIPTQGLNPVLLHCRRALNRLSHQGNPWNLKPLLYSWKFGALQGQTWIVVVV